MDRLKIGDALFLNYTDFKFHKFKRLTCCLMSPFSVADDGVITSKDLELILF